MAKRAAIQRSRRVHADAIEAHLQAGWFWTKMREKAFDRGLTGGVR
jgi:hypothetical protein